MMVYMGVSLMSGLSGCGVVVFVGPPNVCSRWVRFGLLGSTSYPLPTRGALSD